MTLTFVVLGMAIAATLASVWRDHRVSRDLRRFQQWSRVGSVDGVRTSAGPRVSRIVSVAVSVCCCGVAALWAGRAETTAADDDRPNLVIALDSSKSMYASDVAPSRIHEAVRQAQSVIRTAPVARVAIVSFAGSAVILCPLTEDRDAAIEFTEQLERNPAGGRGSDIGLGLRRAADAFGAVRGERIVLLISDGEATDGNLEAAVVRMQAERVRVLTVGAGTVEGAPVPARPASPTLQRDPIARQAERTRLDEETLTGVAQETGGVYVHLRAGDDLSSALVAAWTPGVDAPAGRTAPFLVARVLLAIGLAALGIDTAWHAVRNRRSRFA
jgi:Ca-activated chloride channel family protein